MLYEYITLNSTFILAIGTIILAIGTIWSANETYILRKRQSIPIIAIQTKPTDNCPRIILLSIVNCGSSLAKNIILKTTSEFPVTYGLYNIPTVPLKSLGIFNRPFDLGTGQKYEFVLRDLAIDYQKLLEENRLKFLIFAEYSDIYENSYNMQYNFDLELYNHLQFPVTPD